MFSCLNPRRTSSDTYLFSLVLNQTFDETPAEVRVTREFMCSPNRSTSGDQLPQYFPRTSIASNASISAVCPASRRRSGDIAPPDYDTLSPCPSSPIEIVNDEDDDNDIQYPSLYRHLSVRAHQSSLLHPWFITKWPTPFIRQGQLVELELIYDEATIVTRACIASISYIGATWTHFCVEREDAAGSENRKLKLIVPRIWCQLPRTLPFRDFPRRRPRVDTHEPFDPAGERQVAAHSFLIPVHWEHADREEVEAYKRRTCAIAILTGRSRYAL